MKAGMGTPTQTHPGHQRFQPGTTRHKALYFLWGQNRFPNNPLGSHLFWIISSGACLSSQINTPATSSHTADFPPFFSPQRARLSHRKILHVCKPQTAMGSWTQPQSTHGQHLPWPSVGHSSHASALGTWWIFCPDAPHGKTNKHTHTFWQSHHPATAGGWEAPPCQQKLLLCSGRHREHQVPCSATNFLLSLGKVT